MYTCCVFSGEFQVVNPWLLKELIECKLQDETMRNIAIAHGGKLLVTCSDHSLTFMWLGSVQCIPNIPVNIKAIYKTVWEISQKKHLDLELPWHVYLPKPEFECSHAESNCQSTGASWRSQSSLRPAYVLHRHACISMGGRRALRCIHTFITH